MSEPIPLKKEAAKTEDPKQKSAQSAGGTTTTETRVEIGFFARKVVQTSSTPPGHGGGDPDPDKP